MRFVMENFNLDNLEDIKKLDKFCDMTKYASDADLFYKNQGAEVYVVGGNSPTENGKKYILLKKINFCYLILMSAIM